jgi:hypothetical protein
MLNVPMRQITTHVGSSPGHEAMVVGCGQPCNPTGQGTIADELRTAGA